ncbi:MAG TPA: histidine kinase dimerization/phospho-acceptor domain-containing protein, partial [Thermoanaerobaculia bacterium]|nr:histidine kinase dimerization/phospho-acceptor domain-containing protein [Thermoanaerobaculia bacterium]
MLQKAVPGTRAALVRAGQIALTFGVFAFFNAISFHFEIESGVSILFPAAAISIIACMRLGVWGAIGVILGTLVTPWGPVTARQLVLSALLVTAEGMIPYLVFKFRRDLSDDLRDMKSLVVFLIFGTVVNSAISAILGNLLVVEQPPGVTLVWRQVFVWWISDFTAALLIATPVLAFGGTLLHKRTDERPRTIGNALQIVTVIILLGFAASFAIRTYLLNRLEQERLDQQQAWIEAQETLNRMHGNFLRAAFIDPNDPAAAIKLDAARRTNEDYFRAIQTATAGASEELSRELPLVGAATTHWFESAKAAIDGSTAHQTGRRILALRGMMDRANAAAWRDFMATRRKIMLVAALVDAIVFSILILATTTLLYTISRPFAQLRAGIRGIREGVPFDAARVDSRYLEFRSIAQTLEETASELRRREEELRLQTEKAIKASRHKSDFLAKMSHELRTPLNSIIGFSDLLSEQEATITTTKRLGFLENVAGSARHLLKLINDLLDIAKVESGKMKLHLENVDLRMSIASTVASIQPLFVRKKQEVEIVTPDEPMIARADAGRIEQVLLNLLSNANKFSPEGETIVVSGGAEAGMWRIEVADRGIGISSADH